MDFTESVTVLDDARALRDGRTENSFSSFYRRFGKRTFDVVLVLVLAPVIMPIVAILWLLVRRDGGAGFFAHKRVGEGGKMFQCWKIRTMVVDSEQRLKDHLAQNPAAAEEWARDHKLADDPRVTPIGNFLRKTSLDELPQIWNVLRGDMSFVGPRPIVIEEMPKYGRHQATYLAMKPGVTGLWQVSGRNDVSYDERVEMDVDYFERIGMGLDASLIFKTGAAVMMRTGK